MITGQFFKMWFILQLQLPKDIHLANTLTGLTRMMKNVSRIWKKTTACIRHIKMILVLYPIRPPTAIVVRESRKNTEKFHDALKKVYDPKRKVGKILQ